MRSLLTGRQLATAIFSHQSSDIDLTFCHMVDSKLGRQNWRIIIIIIIPVIIKNSWTVDTNMIMLRSPPPNFPSDLTINPNVKMKHPRFFLMIKLHFQRWRNRNPGTTEKRGISRDLFETLIQGWKCSGHGDLLVFVSSVDFELIIVYSDSFVWVSKEERYLEGWIY